MWRVSEIPNKKLENSTSTLTNPVATVKNTYVRRERRDNMFSVSLQVAKNKARTSNAEVLPSSAPAVHILNTGNKILNCINVPPLNAKIKDINQDHETFFNNNIKFYRELIRKYRFSKSTEYVNRTKPVLLNSNSSIEPPTNIPNSLNNSTVENKKYFLGHKQKNKTTA